MNSVKSESYFENYSHRIGDMGHIESYNPSLAYMVGSCGTYVGYQKITEDKASDANLPDAEIAFQPLTRTSRPLSDADLSQLCISTQTQAGAAPRYNTDASL